MTPEAQQVFDRITATYAENPKARVDWGSSRIYRLCAQDHEFAQALMELDNPRHEAALLEAERSSWPRYSTPSNHP
jgi:hypothetical protein